MKPVIRRILFSGLAVLFLVGCGAAERSALSVGDQSISEEGLTELVIAVNGGLPEGEDPSSLPADLYRRDGGTWLQLAANIEYLDDLGIEITDDDEAGIKTQLENAMSSGQIGPVARDGEAWEAFVWSFFLSNTPIVELSDPAAQEAIIDYLADAEISSRVGELDIESLRAGEAFAVNPRG